MKVVEVKLLAELIRNIELKPKEAEDLRWVMSNGMKFKEWMKDNEPDFVVLAKCMKLELQRSRVRADIFRVLIQRYNRLFSDLNRATSFALLKGAA